MVMDMTILIYLVLAE